MNWLTCRPKIRVAKGERGFTLTELMVVVAIVAIVAAIAVPLLTADHSEADLNKFVEKFVQDVRRAHIEAISSREERALQITNSNGQSQWNLTQVSPGAPTDTHTLLSRNILPSNVVIVAVSSINALPIEGNTYSAPTVTAPVAAMTGDAEIRFRCTGEADSNITTATTFEPTTVFFSTDSGRFRARVVISPQNSFVKYFPSW